MSTFMFRYVFFVYLLTILQNYEVSQFLLYKLWKQQKVG